MRTLHIGLAAVASAALFSVAGVHAADPATPPSASAASRVGAGTYTVDDHHTLVGWKVNHLGINDYFGLIGDVTGTLQIDPADISATKLDVGIPVSKIITANPALTAHLLSPGKDGGTPDFFGDHPANATFKSTSVRSTGGNQALITGILTLNGVSKPVSIMAEFTGAGRNDYTKKDNIGFRGWGRIKRSDFGLKFGTPVISDDVDLNISAAFMK